MNVVLDYLQSNNITYNTIEVLDSKIPELLNVGVATNYFSQWGVDRLMNILFFKNKKNGIFVDIGANNGKEINNTYYYEKILNWTGLCFEPNPFVYKKLLENRSCICYNACIFNEMKILDFTILNDEKIDALSGITEKYNKKHITRIENEIRNSGLINPYIHINSFASHLQWFLDAHHIKNIDFLSVDVEGSEFEVLKSIDFDKTNVDIIAFEDNYREDSIPIVKFLIEKNFELVMRLGGDFIMINKYFK